jgi:Tfp pilus assembly protein PilO
MMDAKPALHHILRQPLVIIALFALGASLVLLALLAAFVWDPARAGAAEAEAGLERALGDLREVRIRARIARDYATLHRQVELLEAKLRQSKPEPEFVREVEALVTRSGAAVAQFSSHSAEDNAGVSTTYFEFFLTGSYASLRDFISGLRDLNDFVAMERVSLESNGSGVRAYLILRRRHRVD